MPLFKRKNNDKKVAKETKLLEAIKDVNFGKEKIKSIPMDYPAMCTKLYEGLKKYNLEAKKIKESKDDKGNQTLKVKKDTVGTKLLTNIMNTTIDCPDADPEAEAKDYQKNIADLQMHCVAAYNSSLQIGKRSVLANQDVKAKFQEMANDLNALKQLAK